MLTTVSMSYPYANVYKMLRALTSPHMEMAKRVDVFGDETTDEYSQRQSYVMKTSQSNAIQAVYELLGIPYEMRTESISVLSAMEKMPAAKVLQPGDQLLQVDGVPITDLDSMLNYIATKEIGEEIEIHFRRGDKELETVIPLVELDSAPDEPASAKPRPGIGIYLAVVQSIAAADENKQVNLKVENIGGPSAGLMFALEIYNLLTEEDITKGYRIAGTGQINPAGEVGVIGGIQYKIVAAEREEADLFFAPKDRHPILNYTLAAEKAKEIKTDMKIVPVGTLQEALDYLKQLPPKQE